MPLLINAAKTLRRFLSKPLPLPLFFKYIPHLLLYFALMDLAFKSIETFAEKTLNAQTLVFFLTAIGICLSLASVSFSYASNSQNSKNEIILAGEHLFHAAIIFLSALLVRWILVIWQQFFDRYIWHAIANSIIYYLQISILVLSNILALFAVMSISRAIWKLNEVLSPKTRDRRIIG